ncbi:hypothetical protein SGFS_093910 [Streptomyces graminofaciens]|uniref:Uncharacterized protein n=1 Tax=Streptomyces graminofaciens TaxID=68212 RepID=A0ABM8HMM6_9ACTN|nr:hypothetical protein SGFS_093910 [Streptomyces graminofaciens]
MRASYQCGADADASRDDTTVEVPSLVTGSWGLGQCAPEGPGMVEGGLRGMRSGKPVALETSAEAPVAMTTPSEETVRPWSRGTVRPRAPRPRPARPAAARR